MAINESGDNCSGENDCVAVIDVMIMIDSDDDSCYAEVGWCLIISGIDGGN